MPRRTDLFKPFQGEAFIHDLDAIPDHPTCNSDVVCLDVEGHRLEGVSRLDPPEQFQEVQRMRVAQSAILHPRLDQVAVRGVKHEFASQSPDACAA